MTAAKNRLVVLKAKICNVNEYQRSLHSRKHIYKQKKNVRFTLIVIDIIFIFRIIDALIFKSPIIRFEKITQCESFEYYEDNHKNKVA